MVIKEYLKEKWLYLFALIICLLNYFVHFLLYGDIVYKPLYIFESIIPPGVLLAVLVKIVFSGLNKKTKIARLILTILLGLILTNPIAPYYGHYLSIDSRIPVDEYKIKKVNLVIFSIYSYDATSYYEAGGVKMEGVIKRDLSIGVLGYIITLFEFEAIS